jgi:catechol 2,3-dioxygenase-like lactoylglutathione lyase family enzyme
MLFKRIDHIGVFVDDLDEAQKFLGETLGLEKVCSLHTPDRADDVSYRCGDTAIEVIHFVQQDEQAARLPAGAPARIDHIAFEVDDIGATAMALKGLGIAVTEPQKGFGFLFARAETGAVEGVRYDEKPFALLFANTDPTTSDGVRYQLIQRDGVTVDEATETQRPDSWQASGRG